MTEKPLIKNVRVSAEYSDIPPYFLGDALLDIFASPPSNEAVNIILNQNLSLKIQKKFLITQKELELFNNLKSFYAISHDSQLVHIILNNFQQNPKF